MKVKTVGGLDPSTVKLALVESSDPHREVPTLHTYYFTHEEIEDKADEAFNWLFDTIMKIRERDGQSPIIYLEKPVVGRGGPDATIKQAFISGALLVACRQADCIVRLINNQSWKKRVCGSGGIGKPEVREAMYEIWPRLMKKIPIMEKGDFKGFPDQDLIDAGALARYGWWHVDLLGRMKKRRRQAA